MLEHERRNGQHADAVLVDEERIFVGAVRAAPVFDDAQTSCRDLVDDAVVEQDHAVGDVLLQPAAGELTIASLAGDHGGDALVFQPAKEAPQLRPQDGGIGKAAEQRFDRVQRDALGPDRIDRIPQSDEEALEVVLASLLNLGTLDAHVVDDELFLPDELVEIETQGTNVSSKFFGGFLECHENAVLAVVYHSTDKKLHCE